MWRILASLIVLSVRSADMNVDAENFRQWTNVTSLMTYSIKLSFNYGGFEGVNNLRLRISEICVACIVEKEWIDLIASRMNSNLFGQVIALDSSFRHGQKWKRRRKAVRESTLPKHLLKICLTTNNSEVLISALRSFVWRVVLETKVLTKADINKVFDKILKMSSTCQDTERLILYCALYRFADNVEIHFRQIPSDVYLFVNEQLIHNEEIPLDLLRALLPKACAARGTREEMAAVCPQPN